jgi:hypothetical protein
VEDQILGTYKIKGTLKIFYYIPFYLEGKKVKVNQSHYRPGVAQRVPGS